MASLELEIVGITVILTLIGTAFRWPLTFIHLIIATLLGLSLNLIVDYSSIDAFIVLHLLGSTMLFLIMLELSGMRKACNQRISALVMSKGARKKSIISAMTVSLGLIGYHYNVVGIPLFSDDIGVARFQLTGSGLFGIPSRFASYAPTLILLYILCMLNLGVVRKRLAFFLLCIVAVLLLFQGHKSAATIAVIGYSCVPNFKSIRRLFQKLCS